MTEFKLFEEYIEYMEERGEKRERRRKLNDNIFKVSSNITAFEVSLFEVLKSISDYLANLEEKVDTIEDRLRGVEEVIRAIMEMYGKIGKEKMDTCIHNEKGYCMAYEYKNPPKGRKYIERDGKFYSEPNPIRCYFCNKYESETEKYR